MAASTIFYSVTRGATDLTRKVIELDSAMVNLQRVMDMPDYKFNDMLEQSIVNVENLSGKLSDYLNLVTEFGRMGFNNIDTLDMANTAQTLTNISDLNADESVSSLVAAMTAFNIEAEESIKIADKLNEVDNKFSVTTKTLGQSLNKAASTARTFGVDLDQLIGYTTAIGSATRESGNIVGNSLKTIFSRLTTNDSAISALEAINVSTTDLEGNVRSASDIIDEVAGKWSSLTDAQRQNTAVGVAGVYQLSRWNALMLNHEVAVNATTTAINAQGSATREQEKYNKSLEARINRLSTAWYGLADSVGQSILYDGIVVVTSALEGATKTGDSAVASFGALPIIFGVIGSSIALLSTRFSTWTGTMIANRATAMAATATNGSLSASLLGVAASSTVAQRALMMTGVGIALTAIAGAVTLLTSVVSKHIQEQEEFDLYLEKNTDALGVNRQATEELIDQYNSLTQAKKSGVWDSEKEEEYLAVQQKLGEFFPGLIDSIDSTGQAHIKSKEAIEAEIKATEELIAAQNRLIVENSSAEFEKLNEELNGSWYESFSNFIYGSLESRIEQQKSILESMYENNADDGAIAKEELKLKQLERQFQQTSEQIKGHIFTVANAMSNLEISSDLTNMLQGFVEGLDLTKLDSAQLESFAKEIGTIQENLQTALNEGNKGDFDSYISKLNDLASETKNFDSEYGNLSATLENGNLVTKDRTDIIHVMGEVTEQTYEVTEKYIDKLRELSSAEEQLLGISSAQITETQNLAYIYEELSAKTNLTSREQDLLAETLTKLSAIYPELSSLMKSTNANRSSVIDMINKEMKANEDLLKVIEAHKKGKLTAEEQMTYNSAMGTKARLGNAKQELLALAKIVEAYNRFAQDAASKADALKNSNPYMSEDYEIQARKFAGFANEQAQKTVDLTDNINSLISEMNGYTGSVLSSVEANEKAEKASEKANKENERSIYLADKYKQALEAVNAEIAKQQSLRSNMTTYSQEYRDSLQKEIKLEQQKKKLMQDQATALQKQIASGKIAETGIVTTKSTTTTKSSSSGYTGKYAAQINASATKYGVDPNLIAAIIKQESGFNPNAVSSAGARGLMQLMPGTARGLGVKDSFNATQNIEGGTKYIAQQLKAFGGSIEKALAAYNAGPGNVRKYGGIPPFKETQNYVKKVTANYASYGGGSGTTTTTTTTSDASKEAAQAQQAIDQAKSDLLKLQQDIAASDETIANKQLEYINSQLASFEKRHEELQHNIDDEIQKRQKLDSVSQKYHDSIKNQISRTQIQIQNYQNEKKYLEGLINSTSTTAKVKAELTEKVKALSLAIVDLNINTKELTFERIQATMRRFEEELDDVDYSLSISKANLELLDEGSITHLNGMKEQIPLLERQKKLLQEQEASLRRSLRIHDLTPDQVKEIKEQMEDLSLAIKDVELQTRQMQNSLNSQIADSLSKVKEEYLDGLRKESERAIKSIEDAIDSTEKYYDSLIEKQQERLDTLDEEIEKVDRLKALQEIDDEIGKVKGDKRFSYITAEGEEILTYNKEKVSELEKQRGEMLLQYQREDIKKAIRDEIESLEKARASKVESLRRELEATKIHYDQLISSEEEKWNNLIESAKTGTLDFNTIMDEFYGTSLENLALYAKGVRERAAEVKAAFDMLNEIIKIGNAGEEPNLGLNADDKVSAEAGAANNDKLKSDPSFVQSEKQRAREVISNRKAEGLDTARQEAYLKSLDKYHDGGIVGQTKTSPLTKLANMLFNVKPGEQVVKSLVGELQIPPHNIPNLFTNINAMLGSLVPRQTAMQPSGDTIAIHIDKVIADNPKQFLSDLDMHIRMNKS